MCTTDLKHFGRYRQLYNLTCYQGSCYFVVRSTEFEADRYRGDLYVFRDGQATALTTSGDVGQYYLSADKILIPVPAESGCTALRCIALDGAACGEAAMLPYSVVHMAFLSPDDFLFTALQPRQSDCQPDVSVQSGSCIVADELPFRENGLGIVNGLRRRLYRCRNGHMTPLVPGDLDIRAFSLSPDGRHAAAIGHIHRGQAGYWNRMWLIDLDNGQTQDISLGEEVRHNAVLFLDGSQLLISAILGETYGVYENPRMIVRSIQSGAVRRLAEESEQCFGDTTITDIKGARTLPQALCRMGDGIYLITTIGDSSHLVRIDQNTGRLSVVTNRAGSLCEAAAQDGALFALAYRDVGGCELYRIDPDGSETQLTHFHDRLTRQYPPVSPIPVSFFNHRGEQISGYLLRPPHFDPSASYPGILEIHGGPKMVYTAGYFHEMQLLAACGYCVFFCNPTGSDGRGDAFFDPIRGHYGEEDYRDLMGFVDAVLAAHPYIDPNRLGVAGGSYGGFMTNWIIGHTSRFRAAVSQRGIANWLSCFNTADTGFVFAGDQGGSTPWQDPMHLWRHSPVAYAGQVSTPTLFLHSQEDYRCPVEEAVQMFSALQYHHVESRLVIFQGENHELSRNGKPSNRIRRLQELLDWFDQHLKS